MVARRNCGSRQSPFNRKLVPDLVAVERQSFEQRNLRERRLPVVLLALDVRYLVVLK
jgi:hypothetical protein